LSHELAAMRDEAAQLRSTAATLRVAAQHIAWESGQRRLACVIACERVRPVERFRFQSAWSDLRWRPPVRDLDRVLVAVGSSDG
jgi:hypothetical protein